jgi:hypothetical protein
MQQNKFANVLASVGVLSGLIIATKKNKNIGMTTLYALGLGIAGFYIGNSISKFYE